MIGLQTSGCGKRPFSRLLFNVLFRRAQVNADQSVLASGIEMSIRQCRIRADAVGEQLGAGHRLEAIGRRGCEQEFAVFCENEQALSSQSDRPRAEAVFAPANFSGLQFDTAKVLAVFLPAIEPEQEPAIVHAGSVM